MTVDLAEARRALERAVPEAAQKSGAVRFVRAPGRINLIGEHTDYNDGFVLPMAIDREIVIAFVPADDRTVELTRTDTGERATFDLDEASAARGVWVDYVRGMATVLRTHGVPLRGMRGVIASTLPIAVGLSSSAAVEIAAAWALAGGEEAPLPALELARAGQDVENAFIGLRSGPMDQLAAVFGSGDGALLVDCRSLELRAVRLPLERHSIVAVDSGSPRRLSASGYNERRAACEAVVGALARSHPGIRALRDVTLDMLDEARHALDPTQAARAEHVVRENDRVLACAAALESGDLATIGALLAASHASLRDLYGVSSPELDALVEIASDVPGVVGARMTGAGFGGSIVVIVERDAVDALRRAIADAYPGLTGRTATLHEVAPAPGAGPISPAA